MSVCYLSMSWAVSACHRKHGVVSTKCNCCLTSEHIYRFMMLVFTTSNRRSLAHILSCFLSCIHSWDSLVTKVTKLESWNPVCFISIQESLFLFLPLCMGLGGTDAQIVQDQARTSIWLCLIVRHALRRKPTKHKAWCMPVFHPQPVNIAGIVNFSPSTCRTKRPRLAQNPDFY